jgi:hypothetical protein
MDVDDAKKMQERQHKFEKVVTRVRESYARIKAKRDQLTTKKI